MFSSTKQSFYLSLESQFTIWWKFSTKTIFIISTHCAIFKHYEKLIEVDSEKNGKKSERLSSISETLELSSFAFKGNSKEKCLNKKIVTNVNNVQRIFVTILFSIMKFTEKYAIMDFEGLKLAKFSLRRFCCMITQEP